MQILINEKKLNLPQVSTQPIKETLKILFKQLIKDIITKHRNPLETYPNNKALIDK